MAHPLQLAFTPTRAVRPGFGQAGRRITVKANWFKVGLGWGKRRSDNGRTVPPTGLSVWGLRHEVRAQVARTRAPQTRLARAQLLSYRPCLDRLLTCTTRPA